MASVITDKEKLNAGMEATADAIREKTGESAPIPWDYEGETGFAAAVAAIPAGREPVIEPITITENGIYTVPAGVDGYGPIIVGVAVRSPRCDQVVTFDWGSQQQYMAWMDGTPEPRPEPDPPTPPTPPTPVQNVWVNGTDAEVAAVLDAAAAGTIDLQQDAGWSVGDVRTITVGAFTNSSGSTTQPKATRIVISSFAEYNGCGNLLQFDFVDETYWGPTMDEDPNFVGGYGDTDLYSVTIPALVEALPTWLKIRLKTFSVLTGSGGADPTIVAVPGNKLAPRSEVEVFGTHQYSVEGEGAQLPFYQTEANKNKYYDDAVIGPTPMQYWFRSPTVGLAYSNQHFVYANGGWHVPYYPHQREAHSTTGFAPFGCLGGSPTFETGSDEEIAALLDAAQAGTVDLQRDAGWRIGDKRTIHLNAWTGGGNTAHAAQDINIVITSFDEYMGCGNVLQFDFYSCPANLQRMNGTQSSVGGYGVTEMYTTTLPALAEALPAWMKARLKTFSVLASEGGNDPQTILTVTGNKLALRSAVEVCGLTEFVTPGEGEQLPYYQTVANRRKQYTTSITNPIWWTRTSGGAFGFRGVLNDDPSITTASNSDSQNLLAPFGCL